MAPFFSNLTFGCSSGYPAFRRLPILNLQERRKLLNLVHVHLFGFEKFHPLRRFKEEETFQQPKFKVFCQRSSDCEPNCAGADAGTHKHWQGTPLLIGISRTTCICCLLTRFIFSQIYHKRALLVPLKKCHLSKQMTFLTSRRRVTS